MTDLLEIYTILGIEGIVFGGFAVKVNFLKLVFLFSCGIILNDVLLDDSQISLVQLVVFGLSAFVGAAVVSGLKEFHIENRILNLFLSPIIYIIIIIFSILLFFSHRYAPTLALYFRAKLLIYAAKYRISKLVNKQLSTKKNSTLVSAAREGNTTLLAMQILTSRIDIEQKGHYGETALIAAAASARTKEVELLILAGADIEAKDYQHWTPLFCAVNADERRGVIKDYLKVAKILIDANADVNAIDKYGKSLLSFAIGTSNHEMIRLLIEKGANVNFKDKYGRTPLFNLIYFPHFSFSQNYNLRVIVGLLFAEQADVNIQDEDGNTALMMAARNGKSEIVKLLIEFNANVNLRNKYGQTALSMAEGNDVIWLIVQAGGEK
ncbi:MAG: ankyrin repeat domain-containing protein [Candidatus Pacebacteria bacterium]|nr:ankyrin repeat domain-containing protein [Candidatus Paceibacterota bacterium]